MILVRKKISEQTEAVKQINDMITPKALEGFGFKKNPRHSKEYNLKKLRVKIIVNRVDLWIGKEFIASLKYVDELEKYL